MDWEKPTTWALLIVDDEPDNRDLVAVYFRFLGATVQTAEDGQAGLEQLETFRPTLILLDLSMPKMDGWEMLSVLRKDPLLRQITTIALTAHAMPADKERVRAAGFNGYITKPISLPRLQHDLQKALLQFETRQENADAKA